MKLLQHQIDGLQKLKVIESLGKGGIIADDMGLGKTFQMAAYLKLNKIENMTIVKRGKEKIVYKPDLIVCPFSLLKYWKEQIEKLYSEFDLSGPRKVRVILYHGKEKDERLLGEKYDYAIVTYGSVSENLSRISWGRIVLDEAHNIKNGVSKKPPASALKIYDLVSSAEYRWCISGTPFNNRVTDLASLAKFIDTEPYNSLLWWKKATPVEIEEWRSTYILRRTKESLVKPPIYHDYKIEPTDDEKEEIEKLKKIAENKFDQWTEAKGELKSSLQGDILALITRLRIYSNSYLCGKEFISADHAIKKCAKISKTIDLLEEVVETDPVKAVVIFSQFTQYLDLLQEVINEVLDIEILRFDGTMNENQREEVIENFTKSEEPRVLLISLMAGGVGINLKPCATIFISEPWYNPFIEKQAEERVHRIGQDSQVHVHKFLVNNSVETWITALKAKKMEKANDLSLVNKWDVKGDYKFVDLCDLFNKHVSISKNKKVVRDKQASSKKTPSPVTVTASRVMSINDFRNVRRSYI